MDNAFNINLRDVCQTKKSVLCIGLDVEASRLPRHLSATLPELEQFSKDVVDCTIDFCPVYKINLGFFERYGSKGFSWMERLLGHINHQAITIADGKRGDIGNSAAQYATSLFDTFGFDAATVNPYMGRDSILPFTDRYEKGAFVLCLTSNPGSGDVQQLPSNGRFIYQVIAEMVMELNTNNNLGLVVGATHPEDMAGLRTQSNGLSWLIPGVGAQGGELEASVKLGNDGGVGIINISRGVLYAGDSRQDQIRVAALTYNHIIQKAL